jgi:hypothetical protein
VICAVAKEGKRDATILRTKRGRNILIFISPPRCDVQLGGSYVYTKRRIIDETSGYLNLLVRPIQFIWKAL